MATLREQKNIVGTRKTNLARLCANQFNNNKTKLASDAGIDPSQINNALSDNDKHWRPMGDKLARRIETGLGLPVGYLDQPTELRPSDERIRALLDLATELELYGWEEDAQTLREVVGDIGKRYRIEFDGFIGTVVGAYRRTDGEEGVVMQMDGSKVVHIYRRQWLIPAEIPPAAPPAEETPPAVAPPADSGAQP